MTPRLAAVCGLALAAVPALAQQQPRTPPSPAPPQPPAAEVPAANLAVLQTLDKITGRVRTLEARLGQPMRFGTLEIVARACHKRPPEEPPESAGLLEIREIRPGEAARAVFSGWMFASSPALSAMEHPVYDLWIIDCRIASPASPSTR